MTIPTHAAEEQGEVQEEIMAVEGSILSQCLCRLHHISKSFGNDLFIKAVKVILHHLSLQSTALFSYHHSLAMVAQMYPELTMPEISFKLPQKPSMDGAIASSSKGTLHPANWEIVQDYNC